MKSHASAEWEKQALDDLFRKSHAVKAWKQEQETRLEEARENHHQLKEEVQKMGHETSEKMIELANKLRGNKLILNHSNFKIVFRLTLLRSCGVL